MASITKKQKAEIEGKMVELAGKGNRHIVGIAAQADPDRLMPLDDKIERMPFVASYGYTGNGRETTRVLFKPAKDAKLELHKYKLKRVTLWAEIVR